MFFIIVSFFRRGVFKLETTRFFILKRLFSNPEEHNVQLSDLSRKAF